MSLLKQIIDFLFPKISLWDQTEGDYLSKRGKKTLQTHPEICPASHFHSPDYKTLPIYHKSFACEGIHIGFVYNDYVKKLILKLKYDHRYDIAIFLAQRLALSMQSNQTIMRKIQKYPSYISYIPSHRWRKLFFRWYNQSELLAKALSKELNIPIIELYSKIRYTRSQAQLNRKQRLQNLQWAFVMKKLDIPANACIIIVDDIVTTASTINQLAQLTKKQYPKAHIRWAVIARHQG